MIIFKKLDLFCPPLHSYFSIEPEAIWCEGRGNRNSGGSREIFRIKGDTDTRIDGKYELLMVFPPILDHSNVGRSSCSYHIHPIFIGASFISHVFFFLCFSASDYLAPLFFLLLLVSEKERLHLNFVLKFDPCFIWNEKLPIDSGLVGFHSLLRSKFVYLQRD